MSLETEINIPRYLSDIVEVGIWHYYYVKDDDNFNSSIENHSAINKTRSR